MKRRLSFPVFRLTVVLALLVALVGTAWAHRGPSVEITETPGEPSDEFCGPVANDASTFGSLKAQYR